MRCRWKLKGGLTIILAVLYCTGYLLIEQHPRRPAIVFGLTPIDHWIVFSPQWVWVYQSVYLLLPFAWLATTMDQARKYGIGFAATTLIGFSCFWLCPVPQARDQSPPPAPACSDC